jgi:phosphoribosylformylglycinamidine (FGAM) synthase PurS component
MAYHIEVALKKSSRDQHGEHVRHDVVDLGLPRVPEVSYASVYSIDGDSLTAEEVETIARDLLIDPVTQTYSITSADFLSEKTKKGGARTPQHRGLVEERGHRYRRGKRH